MRFQNVHEYRRILLFYCFSPIDYNEYNLRRMALTRTERFLDLYKKLEELLEARYTRQKRRGYINPIMAFSNDKEGSRFREELTLCREVRNLLSHHARFDGENAVEPSESLIRFLEKLILHLENPPNALSIATRTGELLRAGCGDALMAIMSEMEKRGFSHVPVLEGRVLYGVLSVSTLFSHFRDHPDVMLGRDATVKQLWDELPVDRHVTERFEFVAAEEGYMGLVEMFNDGGPRQRRVAALFVTKNGKSDAPLLGMITPWDMLRSQPEL